MLPTMEQLDNCDPFGEWSVALGAVSLGTKQFMWGHENHARNVFLLLRLREY